MAPGRAPGTATGIALYLTGVFFFALNDALGKWLVADYGVGQLMMLRAIGAAAIILPLIRGLGVDMRGFPHAGLQILRIVCMAADTFCFYDSTRTMPLADVITFYMSAPLILTAFSALLLRENVSISQWAAVVVGFIGVLIALQPTSAAFAPGALIALAGATMYALGQTVTRRLRQIHWLSLVAWQFVGSALIGAATIPWSWTTPGPLDLSLMFLVGVVSMACFVCLTRALAVASPAVLAPFQYTSLVWGAVLGWIVWRNAPTPPIILGSAIIIGSGLFALLGGRAAKSGAEGRGVKLAEREAAGEPMRSSTSTPSF